MTMKTRNVLTTAAAGSQIMTHHRDLVDFLMPESLGKSRELLAQDGFSLGADPKALASVLAGAMEEVDRMGATILAGHAQDGNTPGCREGCTWCCYQEVTVSTVELVALVALIQPDDLPEARERIAETQAKLGRMKPGKSRSTNGIACPFLENKRCGIYTVRPQSCRTHYSMSRSACEQEWRGRLVAARSGYRGPGVPMPTGPKAVGFAMMLGFDAAVHELGFEVELVELTEGMAIILEEGAMDRWLAGERVFTNVGRISDGRPYSTLLEETAPRRPRRSPCDC